jgi:hypothetical protein
MPRCLFLSALYWAVNASLAAAQTPLPIVEDVPDTELRQQIKLLREVMNDSLTETDRATLERAANEKPENAANFSENVQKLLDPYCLIGVTINPESRVKAARGPRGSELVRGQETLVLIKVQNEAGVTQGLKVTGDQLRTAKGGDKNCWLEASVCDQKPSAAKLSGQKLEYVVLRLKAHEAGKREATLKFDVGQGTQDLGFRAEVPILFKVKTPE